MSSPEYCRVYDDSVEDYIRSLVELVIPDYEIWRPYFEFDIEYMIDLLRSPNKDRNASGGLRIFELASRFLDESLPLWVREKILERMIAREGSSGGVFEIFMRSVIIVNDRETNGRALMNMTRDSSLARKVFGSVEL